MGMYKDGWSGVRVPTLICARRKSIKAHCSSWPVVRFVPDRIHGRESMPSFTYYIKPLLCWLRSTMYLALVASFLSNQPSNNQCDQPKTLPATLDWLLSLVSTFFNPLPLTISSSKAPTIGGFPPAALGPGGGGGGGGGTSGAPPNDPGMGGGGGGPLGAPFAAGIGGGGGGAGGASIVGIVGVDGDATPRSAVGDFLSSMVDNGRGGAMVPNRIDARCLAPVGRSSSSSSEESSVESTTDHSSSSGLTRDGRVPGGAGGGGRFDLAAFSC